MPNLNILWITTNYPFPPTDTHYLRFIGTPEIMNVMAQLPLKTVDIEMMHLGTGSLNLDLGIIWPNVTFLALPSQYASLQELSYFAALPKLEHLIVRLDLTTIYTPKNIPRSNRAPMYKLEGSEGSKLPKNFEVMTHNIRIIQRLWPDAKEAEWSYSDKKQPLFLNLAKSFRKLLVLHSLITMYQANSKGHLGYEEERVSDLRALCEELRVKVDSGANPCECGACVSSSHVSDN